VAVTAEHYALVAWPIRAKIWFSMRSAHWLIAISAPLAAVLHSIYLTRRVVRMNTCPVDASIVSYQYLSTSERESSYEKVYYYLTAILINVGPLLLLLWCSVGVTRALLCLGKFRTNSQQKQCVIRLALATTACHLVFEFPSVRRSTYIRCSHLPPFRLLCSSSLPSSWRPTRCRHCCWRCCRRRSASPTS
jgi:hypothetical protein